MRIWPLPFSIPGLDRYGVIRCVRLWYKSAGNFNISSQTLRFSSGHVFLKIATREPGTRYAV